MTKNNFFLKPWHTALVAVAILANWAFAFDVGADLATYGCPAGSLCSPPIASGEIAGAGTGAGTTISVAADSIYICGGTRILSGITPERNIVIGYQSGANVLACPSLTTLILDNVTVATSNKPAISALGNLTLKLRRGENKKNEIRAFGGGYAGIYVPYGVTLTIDNEDSCPTIGTCLPSGSLTVKGAGAVSAKGVAGLDEVTGGGAGIGSNGAMVNSNKSGQHRPATNFGTININGGKLTAIGGWGIYTQHSIAGGGAGIGGAGAALYKCTGGVCTGPNGDPDPRQPSTTAAGNGNITITGGTILVKGGSVEDGGGNLTKLTALHAIGNGQNIGSNGQMVETPATPTGITVTISGGSVTALDTNTNNTPVSGRIFPAPSGRTRQVLQFGNTTAGLERSKDKLVTACKFAATPVTCVQSATVGTNQYGINGVYTGENSRVYFWLNTTGGVGTTAQDSLSLDAVPNLDEHPMPELTQYGYTGTVAGNGTDANPRIYQDKYIVPTMIYPKETMNGLVGTQLAPGSDVLTGAGEICNESSDGTCDVVGPYKTGYRMNGYRHVAAVNHAITIFKGQISLKSAGEEATHDVTWYRTTAACITNGNLDTTQTGCTRALAASPSNNTKNIANNTIGTTSTATASYTPGADDYGNYIWADITVKGTGAPAGAVWSTTVYPLIQVGVITSIKVTDDADAEIREFLDEDVCNPADPLYDASTCKIKSGVLQLGGARADGWYMPTYPLNLSVSVDNLNTLVSTWFACKGNDALIGVGQSFECTNPAGGSFGGGNRANPASYTMPSSINDDIVFVVRIKDGSVSELEKIEICKDDVEDAVCHEKVVAFRVVNQNSKGGDDKVGDLWLLKTDGETDSIKIPLLYKDDNGNDIVVPKSGKIILTFDDQISNITTGTINLDSIGASKDLAAVATNQNNASVGTKSYAAYLYGQTTNLAPGEIYGLEISGFMNRKGNGITPVSGKIKVEKKATVDLAGSSESCENAYCYSGGYNAYWGNTFENKNRFLVGDSVLAKFEYVKNQGHTETGVEYYWEFSEASSKPAEGKPIEYDFDNAYAAAANKSSASSAATAAPKIKLAKEDFGKWVRLVIRPASEEKVDGDSLGAPVFGAWKHIGVLLVPGLPESGDNVPCVAGTCPTFSKVSFKGCDITAVDETISGCTEDGFMVYTEDPIKLGADLTMIESAPDKYDEYKITGWEDDTGNTCASANTVFINCAQSILKFAKEPVSNIPEGGKLVVTPVVIKKASPLIASLTLKNADEGTVYLKEETSPGVYAEIDGDSIAVLGNELNITFNMALDATPPASPVGLIRLVRGSVEKSLADLCVWNFTNTVCSIDLDGIFEAAPFDALNIFDASFKLVVSGFKSAQEQMQNEQFYFTTAPGPVIKIASLDSDLPAGTTGFAVAHEITAALEDYAQNGGSAEGAHVCRWERRVNGGAAVTINSGACATNNVYTPIAADYGNEIRLVVIPKDNSGHSGAEVSSAWTQVGVLLKAADVCGIVEEQPCIVKNSAQGNINVLIGSLNASQSKSDGLVVYGVTTVRFTSDVATDKIVEWHTPSSGFSPIDAAISNFTPASPSDDIIIACTVEDGDLPVVTAYRSGEDFVISITKEVDVYPGAKITIVEDAGCTGTGDPKECLKWEYTLTGAETLAPDGEGVSLTLSPDKWAGFEDAIGGTPAARYRLEIEAGAFVDGAYNYTVAYPRLLSFSQGGAYYIAALSSRSISMDAVYGEYFVDDFTTKKVTVTNKSSGTVDFKISFAKGAASKFIANSTPSLPASISMDSYFDIEFEILNAMLDAGTYLDTLIIEGIESDEVVIEEAVALTFIVKEKPLDISATPHIALKRPDSTKVYDGTPDISQDKFSPWVWDCGPSGYEPPDFDACGADINVIAETGKFGDATVGSNKPVTAYYVLDGDKAQNYTFNAVPGVRQDTLYYSGLKGSITKRPIDIVFVREGTDSLNLDPPVPKEYDGLNDFVAEPSLYNLDESDVIVINSIRDDVLLDKDNSVFEFRNANAGNNKEVSGIRIALIGTDAGNYMLGNPVLTNLVGTIVPASLLELRSAGGTYAETSGSVEAVATYGDSLSRFSSWEEAPNGTVEVEKNGQVLAGSWRICAGLASEPAGTDGCDGKITTGIVVPGQQDVWAYFNVTSPNYQKDLLALVNLTVKPKVISPDVDLTNAGEGNGIKTYDGNDDILGVAVASNASIMVNAADAADLLKVLEVESATFNSANAGSNKQLNVVWKWKDNAALTTADIAIKAEMELKYSPQTTVTLGTVAKKEITLGAGQIVVENKVYDGLRNNAKLNLDNMSPGAVSISEGLVPGQSLNWDYKIDPANIRGTYVSANVNWNVGSMGPPLVAAGADAVVVTFNPNDFELLSGDGGTTNPDNYTLKISDAEGIISQAKLSSEQGGLTLRNRGVYGDELSDIVISTTSNTPDEIRFPRQLDGVEVGATVEKISGIWSWRSDDFSEPVGNATATENGRTACALGDYLNEKFAVFEPQNDNYENDTLSVVLCVLPRKVIVGNPSGMDGKIYDGSSKVPNAVLNQPTNIVLGDNGQILDIESAVYVKSGTETLDSAVGMHDILLKYKWHDDSEPTVVHNYLLPDEFRAFYKEITLRSVEVTGLSVADGSVYDKYYDGLDSARVDIEKAVLKAASGNSGIVASDVGKVALEWSPSLKFVFISPMAGENKSIIADESTGSLFLSGTSASNYTLVYPSLSAEIYKGSLANYVCPELTSSDCDELSKSAKDALLAADLNKGRASKAVAYLLSSPIETTYGHVFSDIVNELGKNLPRELGSLFGGVSTTEGSWSWEASSSNQPTAVGEMTGYAKFEHGNSNYETLSGIPVPVDVGKLSLTYSIVCEDREYEPDNHTVNLSITPLNAVGGVSGDDLKITGIGTVLPDNKVGVSKNVGISELALSGEAASNYIIPEDLLSGLVGTPRVTISKSSNYAAPAAVATPSTFVYDTLSLSSRLDVRLSDGWSWSVETGKAVPDSGHYKSYEVIFYPPDTVNYNPVYSYVNLKADARSRDNSLSEVFEVQSEVCGADSLLLKVTAGNNYASIWYNGISWGTGSAEFKHTGLSYGSNQIEYVIRAQEYASSGFNPDHKYTHRHVRYLPFAAVTRWIRDKSLAASLDTVLLLEKDSKFDLNKIKFDLGKTLWFNGKDSVGAGLVLSVAKTEIEDYNVVLFDKDGWAYASCTESGKYPQLPKRIEDLVPAKAGVKLVASSFGSRVVAGGSALYLDTPHGGSVSVYTMKGELVSKTAAAEGRTLVRVPGASGMYIVKLEAK